MLLVEDVTDKSAESNQMNFYEFIELYVRIESDKLHIIKVFIIFIRRSRDLTTNDQ